MAKKAKQPKESKRVEICACPPGSRAGTHRDNAWQTVCKTMAGGEERYVPKTCSSELRRYDARGGTRVGELARPTVYNYSTPSGVPEIGPAARKERGCLVERKMAIAKKKSKGHERGAEYEKQTKLTYRCPTGSQQKGKTGACVDEAGRDVAPVFDASCGSTSQPCSTGRASCPVQLVYHHGQPALRFCPPFVWKPKKGGGRKRDGSKKPGWLVPVEDGPKAQELAARACAQWEKDGRRFTASNPAAVEARKARIGYAGTGENKNTLGGGPLAWFR